MTSRKGVRSLIGLGVLTGLAGCGGPPPITLPSQPSKPVAVLFVEAPPGKLAVGASATIYATAENSPSNSQVTYSMSCGSADACGTFSASEEVGAIVYTAPAAIPSGTTVTITATAVADSTKSISAVVTIVPPISIVVSFIGAVPASLQINAAVPLRVLITNDVSANPQANWTVTCASSACGSLSPTSTSSPGMTTYTAPAAIPSGATVTITATSVTDPTKSVSANIVITPQAATLANGTYVFQLSGPGGAGTDFVTGVLVALNGSITGGEQDSVTYSSDDDGNLSPYAGPSGQITGGTYASTPDGNLQITINIAPNSYEILNGTLASGQSGFSAQLYGSMGSGTLDLQTATTAPSGGYAISMYGGDATGNPVWIGGIVNVDSADGISGAGSVLDLVGEAIDGIPNGEQSLAASTVSAPAQYGRLQFQLNPSQSSYLPIQTVIGYVVDATHIRLVSLPYNGVDGTEGAMGGVALGQGANTGKFSNISIAGSSYVFGAADQVPYTKFQVAGVLTASSGGALTGTINWNDLTGGQPQTPLSVNGIYAVDSTGRVTLTNVTDGSGFNYSIELYLTGDGNALLLSGSGGQTFAGQAFQQQSGAFSAGSLSGTYGLNAGQSVANATYAPVVGAVTAVPGNSADTLTGFADSGNGAADFALSGNFTPAANGVFSGTVTGLDSASRGAEDNVTLYLVDNTRAIAIETDNSQLTLGYLQLQQ
jgi:hypothetical protein